MEDETVGSSDTNVLGWIVATVDYTESGYRGFHESQQSVSSGHAVVKTLSSSGQCLPLVSFDASQRNQDSIRQVRNTLELALQRFFYAYHSPSWDTNQRNSGGGTASASNFVGDDDTSSQASVKKHKTAEEALGEDGALERLVSRLVNTELDEETHSSNQSRALSEKDIAPEEDSKPKARDGAPARKSFQDSSKDPVQPNATKTQHNNQQNEHAYLQ